MPPATPPSPAADSPVVPPAVAGGRASYRQVLAGREFRVIFAADVVSMLGTVVAAVALTVLVYQRTGSPALAASVMALAFLPYLFGGVLAGAAADRLPARRALIACDLASAALVAAMTIPRIPVAGMLVLLFANGLIAPVYQGVRSALLPDVLPPGPGYVLGRALMRMVAQSAQIAGYGVGGALLAVLSPRGALTLDALSYAASAVLLRAGLAARSARAARATETGSMARDSLAGARRTLAHREIRRILLFGALVAACAIAPEALAAPYAAHIGQPARAAGFLLMGIPAGTVLADVIVARLLPVRLQRRMIVPAGLLVFGPLIGFAASPRLGPAIALLVTSGLGSAWAAGLDGLLIDVTPLPLRGRALALQGAGLMFTQGAGFALWGIAAQYAPLIAVIPAAGVAGGVAVVTLRPRRPGPPRAPEPGPAPARSTAPNQCPASTGTG
jgi:transmembrane secretion effector